MKTFSITAAAIAATSLAIFACSGGSDDTTSSSSSGGSSSGSTNSADGGGASSSSSSSSSSGSTSSSSGGGGTFSCESKSSCPNEPAPDAEAKENCEKVLASECGTEFKAYGQCVLDNEICKSDGTFDQDATQDGPCKSQSEAVQACALAGFDAGQ